eukprot:1168660-Rhodomonas_salina.4
MEGSPGGDGSPSRETMEKAKVLTYAVLLPAVQAAYREPLQQPRQREKGTIPVIVFRARVPMSGTDHAMPPPGAADPPQDVGKAASLPSSHTPRDDRCLRSLCHYQAAGSARVLPGGACGSDEGVWSQGDHLPGSDFLCCFRACCVLRGPDAASAARSSSSAFPAKRCRCPTSRCSR